MNKFIKADLFRYTGLKNNFFKTFLFVPGYRFTWFLRKAKQYENFIIINSFYRIIVRYYQLKYGFQISYRTEIGKGFYIGHYGTIVIADTAIIGDNCNINHGVTIGKTSRGKLKGSPVIGNNVWLGAHSTIVGKIIIGNNVLISPGAFVNFDVPSDSLVIGNPGKIKASKNATNGYINRILN